MQAAKTNRTSLLQQDRQLHVSGSQYKPDVKHSQYSFKQREFLNSGTGIADLPDEEDEAELFLVFLGEGC